MTGKKIFVFLALALLSVQAATENKSKENAAVALLQALQSMNSKEDPQAAVLAEALRSMNLPSQPEVEAVVKDLQSAHLSQTLRTSNPSEAIAADIASSDRIFDPETSTEPFEGLDLLTLLLIILSILGINVRR